MNNISEYYGTKANSVRDVLLKRRKMGYTPGSLSDGNKVALLFEGGAMGGAISCAFGAGFQELGFRSCFDLVYGTSAGALNAAYFCGNQADQALDIYLNDIIGSEFMGALRWPDQVDVQWLAENIVGHGKKSLDKKKVMEAPLRLQIPVTQIDSGKCWFFDSNKEPMESLIPAITASASTPMFVSHQTNIGGSFYNDGMIHSPVSSLKAIEDGATHLVGLLCNPVGRRKKVRLLRSIIDQLLRIRHYPVEYQTVYHSRSVYYNEAMDALHDAPTGVKSMVICPHKLDIVPGNLEKDKEKLTEIVSLQLSRVKQIFSSKKNGATFRNIQDSDVYHT